MTLEADVAADLTTLLRLAHPPVAVSFHAEEVAGESPREPVPAGCCFWAPAEHERLVTEPSDHAGCTVGRRVLGLVPLGEAAGADDVAALVSAGWVSPEDLAAAPTLDRAPATVVYEPLAEAEAADVVLLRVVPQQLMRLQSAVPGLSLVGKPQCQILALAAAGQPAVSPGCAVSRARTGLPAEELTVALPGTSLTEVLVRLGRSTAADDVVAAHVSAAHGSVGGDSSS